MSVLFKFYTDNLNYFNLPEYYIETINLIDNYTLNTGYDRAVNYFGNDYVEIISESEFIIKNKVFEHIIACDLYNTDVVEIILIKDMISDEITRFERIFNENSPRLIMKYDINHSRYLIRFRNQYDSLPTNIKYFAVDTYNLSEIIGNKYFINNNYHFDKDIEIEMLDANIPIIKVKIKNETNYSNELIQEILNHKLNRIGIVFYRNRIILE